MDKKKISEKVNKRPKSQKETLKFQDINALHLCAKDPIAYMLLKFTKQSLWRTLFIVIIVYGIAILGLGVIISKYYESTGVRLMTILDKRDGTFAIFAYLIATPTAWLYYAWEPLATLKLFKGLMINKVIGDSKEQTIAISDFLSKELTSSYGKWSYFISILLVTVIIVYFWVGQVFSAQNTFQFGYTLYWWSINQSYFWIIWIPLTFVNLYMVLWILLRRSITIAVINKLFKTFEIQPKLLHPDKANGMFPIGEYITRSSFLMMIAGVWVFLSIAYPMFFGQGNNLKGDTILFLAIYTISIPAILLIPAWETHLFMAKFKDNVLENTAEQIREVLKKIDSFGTLNTQSSSNPELLKKIEVAEALQRKYNLIEKEYRTWPFNMTILRQFGITTLSPLFSTFISIYIDYVINKFTSTP